MRYWMCIIILIVGCAKTIVPCDPVTIYKEVPIPIKCNAPWPPIPQLDEDPTFNMIKLKNYTLQLIEMGKICKGEGD